jgi:methionyl-tRNA formyltransferase
VLQQLALGSDAAGAEAGIFRVRGERLFFTAADGAALEVLELQLEGKRRMTAAELLRGHGLVDGDRLGS